MAACRRKLFIDNSLRQHANVIPNSVRTSTPLFATFREICFGDETAADLRELAGVMFAGGKATGSVFARKLHECLFNIELAKSSETFLRFEANMSAQKSGEEIAASSYHS